MFIRTFARVASILAIAGCSVGGLVGCGTSQEGSGVFSTDGSVSSEAGGGDTDGSITLLPEDGGVTKACVPTTCAQSGYSCGMNGDGCGGTLDCGSCTAPAYCGGGGYSKCGGGVVIGVDGGPVTSCTPFTCATSPNGPYNCGMTGDGCGGTISCGTCPASQFCGGGGFNQCGGSTGLTPEGGVPCTPATSCPAGQNCGEAANGCGGLLPCGTCANPQFCGGGGASICGGNNGLTPDGGVPCTPATSCPAGQNCGLAADGCGGLLPCGSCTNPQFCGGGGANKCGGNNSLTPDGSVACTPTTCANLGNPCGQQSDGCGGVLDCTVCVLPQTCGGGGIPDKCGGNNGLNPDGGLLCTPKTCASFPGTCGQQADGCGGVTASCGACAAPDTCGGGGVASHCGNSGLLPDGGNPCTPATSCPAGITCGQAADGCGGVVSCGSCSAPNVCGGGGVAGNCGNSGLLPDGGNPCTPTTCSHLGYTCGAAGDGCGGKLQCGTCTDPQYCGGGGYDLCGGNNGLNPDGSVHCTPTTCAALGYNCGVADDGCGGLLSCGSCTTPQYCGGGGFDVCGPSNLSPCPGGGTTALSGYVFDPANNLPIYNALVYVPVGAVVTPPTGVNAAAPVCGCTAPPAYASGYTDVAGHFSLTNVPSGSTKVVVQLGKWQRVFTESVTACGANNLGGGAAGSAQNLTLPSTHLQGNIPRFAVDTGGVDSMECVLSKMGIATSEFVDPAITGGVPTAAGRVHFYQGSIVTGGATIDGATPTEAALTESASVMDSYDVILFPCQGGPGSYTAPTWPNTLGNLLSYTGAGGRMFATHFHYDLLNGNGSFTGTATWDTGGSFGNYYSDPTYNSDIDTSFPVGTKLGQWLNQPSVYGGTLDVIPVGVIRNDISAVNAPAQRWLYTAGSATCASNGAACTSAANCCSGSCTGGYCGGCAPDGNTCTSNGGCCNNNCANNGGGGKSCGGTTPPTGIPIHYTFDTPFNQSPSCGRVVYSDFHVESEQTGTNYSGYTFPNECPGGATGAMTTQEKLLEFMIFDLTSCVSPPSCTPLTCASFPGKCGVQGDGCGGQTANCGTCTAPATCGGGGTASVCGYPDGASCAPLTCASFPGKCGVQGDGCGGQTANCNPCTAPATCGGGGIAGQCGYPDAGCTPRTCASFPATTCGEQSDGCGGHTANCNPCTAPATCGGGGIAGQCGYPDAGCTPASCSSLGFQCGYGANGCGGVTASCGTCAAGSSCINNQCVAVDAGSSCVPKSCTQLGIQCGQTDDGCGALLTCATCPGGATCVFNQCVTPDGGACAPLTCASFPATTCGEQGDGCGGHTADCNPCTPPATCGGGGVPDQCGYPDGGGCVPLTCASFSAGTCGPQADGCGGVTAFCNPCTPPATCGGSGVSNQCGYPDGGSCVPETCAQQSIACGPAGDGCGNVIQCGACVAPETCGGGGVPSQCGLIDAGSCAPLTCASQKIACGPAGDGCGNLLQCGTCQTGTCGGGGTPGQCGGAIQ